MAKLGDLIPGQDNNEVRCESCGAQFAASNVDLDVSKTCNFEQCTSCVTFVYVSKNTEGQWKFYGGTTPPKAGDLIGVCPVCSHKHYFGFNPVW